MEAQQDEPGGYHEGPLGGVGGSCGGQCGGQRQAHRHGQRRAREGGAKRRADLAHGALRCGRLARRRHGHVPQHGSGRLRGGQAEAHAVADERQRDEPRGGARPHEQGQHHHANHLETEPDQHRPRRGEPGGQVTGGGTGDERADRHGGGQVAPRERAQLEEVQVQQGGPADTNPRDVPRNRAFTVDRVDGMMNAAPSAWTARAAISVPAVPDSAASRLPRRRPQAPRRAQSSPCGSGRGRSRRHPVAAAPQVSAPWSGLQRWFVPVRPPVGSCPAAPVLARALSARSMRVHLPVAA